MTEKDRMESKEMNPWLVDEVKEFRCKHSETELQNDFAEQSEKVQDLNWEDYINWRSLIDAINNNPFLKVHRIFMDVPESVREWLYWNNVDRVLDLVQISDEELRAISGDDKTYYEQVTLFLADNNIELRHCSQRTYKIASGCFTLKECPATLDKWMIKPHGNVHTFNVTRPSLFSEWFNEYYRLYCHTGDEEKCCKKIIPVGAGEQSTIAPEYRELLKTLKEVRDHYINVCNKHNIKPIDPSHRIPQNDKELRSTPLYRFIELKKDAFRAAVSVFEQTSLICSLSTHKYIQEENYEKKLDITLSEKDEALQLLMTSLVAMIIDFENLVSYLLYDFKTNPNPCNDWPINPWLQKAIMEYRSIYSDEQLRSQYDNSCKTKRVKTWIAFVSDQALQRKIDDNPSLLTYIKDTSLDESIKKSLIRFKIPTLANLLQFTDNELELLFDGDKNKVRLIDKYLKKNGLHLYHSNLLTYKLSGKIRQLLDQSEKK